MKKLFKKVLVYLSVIAIVVQSLSPVAYLQLNSKAYAQEVTPTDTSTTVDQTTTRTDTATPTPTIEQTTPIDAVTPTPSDTPTETLTPSPTPEPSPADATPVDNLSPPVDNSQVQGESITPTPASNAADATPTPTQVPENPKDEQLNIIVLENVSAPTVNLDAVVSEGSAVLTTDKPDYAPTDTALITGSNLLPNTTYTLRVWSDDEPPTSTTVEVTSDENGVFAYAYQLDGTYRPNYSAELKDSTGTVVATVTFTDAPASGCTNDSGGLNDLPGANQQKDLTKMCANYAGLPTSVGVSWNWDNASFSGNNTGDACALFDNDSDGNANYAVCVQVGGDPGAYITKYVYSCDDSSATNCLGNSPVSSPVTTCSAIVSADDPFPGGADYPDDTVASCTVSLSDVGGALSTLTDVCSYPSDSTPSVASDCIVFKANAGKLTITKVLSPSNDPGLFNLQIDSVTASGGANVTNGGTTLTQSVEAGSHTVGETGGTSTDLSNYTSSVVCRDAHGTGSVVTTTGTNPWTLNVADGQDILCTITNTRVNNGSITIVKDAVPNDAQDFAFTTTGTGLSNFSLDDDGETVILSNTKTFSNLGAGTYSVSEEAVTGWTSDGGVCSDESPVSAIALAAGEDVTCTFTNTRDTGSVKVNKKVDSGSGFVDANPGSFTWSLDTVGANAMGSTVSGVNTGSHNVNENTVTDYHFVGWYPTASTQYSCANPQGTTLPVSISVSANTTTEITLCNAIDTGTVVVHKDVQGPNGEDVTDNSNYFEVSLDTGTGQTILDNSTVTYNNVPVGSHTITESLIDTDYTLYGISTVAGAVGTPTGLSVNVGSGQTVDVYVTNRQKSGTITVIKDVVNPDGGAVSDTHSFTVNLTPGSQTSPLAEGSNAVFTVNPGTYTASETDDANYDELGCKTATGKDDIVVGSGESVTVTCTNQQKKATINVTKDVLSPTNGAVLDNHAFTAQLNGGNDQSFSEATTAAYLVNPGNYSITELYDNNYDYVSCTPDNNQTAGDGAQITVGSNGSATVTCVNKQHNAIVTIVKDVRDPNGANITDNTNFVVQRDGSGTEDKDFRENLNAVYTLAPGTYTFLELVTAGYTLNSISNDNDADVNNGTTVTLLSGQAETITFTNYQNSGSISGQKLGDADGVLGTTDDQTNLIGWVINLYSCTAYGVNCTTFEGTQTTTSGGYSFLNLIPGFYQVQEVLQAGWTNLTSLFQDVTVNPDEDVTDKDFVNFENVSVTACKVIDADGNIATTNDQTPAYWEVGLLVDGQASGGAQFTDRTTGCYTWTDLGPNHTYGVSEGTPAGWTNLTDTTHSFGTAQGGSEYTYTFVNFENVAISGHKWNDLNGDGVWDDGEPALENWTINLSGAVSDSTTTNANGEYSFSNLGPGTYTLSEVEQTGWTQTAPNGGTFTVDAQSGSDVTDRDFGNQGQGSITVIKDVDSDGDGDIDVTGATNWTWDILNGVQNTLTGTPQEVSAGTYTVSEDQKPDYHVTAVSCDDDQSLETTSESVEVTVAPGQDVTCTFTNTRDTGTITVDKATEPSGDEQEFDIVLRDEEDSVVKTSTLSDTDEPDTYTVLSGTYELSEETVPGWDLTDVSCFDSDEAPVNPNEFTVSNEDEIFCTFTNTKRGSVVVTKFLDDNANGVWDDGEEVLGDWDINLTNDEEEYDAKEPTDDTTGEAEFANLVPGTYILSEDIQEGWNQSNISCNNDLLSDGLDNLPFAISFLDNGNEHEVNVDAGQNITCEIGNYQDAEIIVKKVLYQPDGTTVASNDDTQFGFSMTGQDDFNLANGDSQPFEVKPGTYTVSESDIPTNYDFIDCDADYEYGGEGIPATNGEEVTLGSGDDVTVTCYNKQKTGTITGTKWNDINENALRDCELFDLDGELNRRFCEYTEPVLGDWTIFLDENGNGELDGEEVSTTTDSSGNYQFTVNPGTYRVCEVIKNGWDQTYPINSEYESCCYDIEVGSGDELTNYDFGNHSTTPILTISKVNDASGDKSPGNTVGFTITVKADSEGGPADNVTVTDLLPQGFVFNSSSWKVVSSDTTRGVDGNITSLLTAPTYASPGTWSLGHMNSGETLTLSYTATIDGAQQTGTYYDNAWAVGNPVESSDKVFAKAFGDGDLDIPDPDSLFVGTQVSIVNPSQPGVDYKATSTKEVLGAATYLPATGQNTLWVIIATLLSVTGFGMLIAGLRLRRKYA